MYNNSNYHECTPAIAHSSTIIVHNICGYSVQNVVSEFMRLCFVRQFVENKFNSQIKGIA